MSSVQDVDLSRQVSDFSAVPLPRDPWLMDAMPHLVWVADLQGAVTFCNQAWRAYTDQTHEQAQGQGWTGMLSPSERDRVHAHWHEAVQTGSEFQMDYRVRRASHGDYRWHQVHATPVRDASKGLLFWIGVHTEIHDRKLIEEHNRALMRGARCLIWYADIEAPPSDTESTIKSGVRQQENVCSAGNRGRRKIRIISILRTFWRANRESPMVARRRSRRRKQRYRGYMRRE